MCFFGAGSLINPILRSSAEDQQCTQIASEQARSTSLTCQRWHSLWPCHSNSVDPVTGIGDIIWWRESAGSWTPILLIDLQRKHSKYCWDVGILGHSFLHLLITNAGWHPPLSLIASLSTLLMSRCGTEVWCFTSPPGVSGGLRTEPSNSMIKTRLKPRAWTGLFSFSSRGNFIRDQLLYTACSWWKGLPYAVFQYQNTDAGCHPNLKAAVQKYVGRATSEGLKCHIFR